MELMLASLISTENRFFFVLIIASFSCLASIAFFSLIAPQSFSKCLYVLRRTRYHHIHPLSRSIHGISYHAREGDDGITCSLTHAQFSFRFPTFSNPYFFTVELTDIRYYGPWASGCCGRLSVRVRLPRFNQTWCRTCIEDLRLTVRNSKRIPNSIARLRENILRTIVLGEVLRLDHFALSTNTRLLWSGEGLGAVAEAKGYEAAIAGRMYRFGSLKGSLTRNWDTDDGRFLLATEKMLWYKLGVEENEGKTSTSIGDILCYPATLISSLSSALQKPASLLDLEITRGEIKFRKFRDRDHSLEKHAMQFIAEWKPGWMDTAFLKQFTCKVGREVIGGTNLASSQMDI